MTSMEMERLGAMRASIAQYGTGKMDRRQLVQVLGALGIAATALPLATRNARAQDATPAAPGEEGPPPATPELGERPDGTRIWRVVVGGMDMEAMLEINAFMPDEITINAGDSIFFDFGMGGFHNVHLSSAETPAPILIPAEGIELNLEATPAAAAGQPTLAINPAVAFPNPPEGNQTFDGSTDINSGIFFFRDNGVPFAPVFTTPGTYYCMCDVHNGMIGTITVQEAGAKLPAQQADYDAMGEEQLTELLERGRAFAEEYGAAGTPEAGVHEIAAGVSDGQVEALAFLPNRVEISAGDTVRWTNLSAISPHTVTFLGGTPPPEDVIPVEGEGGPPVFVVSPVTFYPSDQQGTYSGEGYLNSGYLFGAEFAEILAGAGLTVPTSFDVTFDTPGEYPFYCILHAGGSESAVDPSDVSAFEGMVGTVVVS